VKKKINTLRFKGESRDRQHKGKRTNNDLQNSLGASK